MRQIRNVVTDRDNVTQTWTMIIISNSKLLFSCLTLLTTTFRDPLLTATSRSLNHPQRGSPSCMLRSTWPLAPLCRQSLVYASVQSLVAGLSTTKDVIHTDIIHTGVIHTDTDKEVGPYITTPFNDFVRCDIGDCLILCFAWIAPNCYFTQEYHVFLRAIGGECSAK